MMWSFASTLAWMPHPTPQYGHVVATVRDCLRRVALDPDGAGRTRRQAGAARSTHRFHQGPIHERSNPSLGSPAQDVDGSDELVAVLASLGAPAAHDARVHSDVEHRIRHIDGFARSAFPSRNVDAVVFGGNREFTVASVGVVVRVREHRHGELEDTSAQVSCPVGLRLDDHAVSRRHRTRRGKASHTVDVHKASPARPDRLHVGVLAELRYVRPGLVDGIQYRRPVADGHLLAVD